MPKSARIAFAALILIAAAGVADTAASASPTGPHSVTRADGDGDGGAVPTSTPQPDDMTWG